MTKHDEMMKILDTICVRFPPGRIYENLAELRAHLTAQRDEIARLEETPVNLHVSIFGRFEAALDNPFHKHDSDLLHFLTDEVIRLCISPKDQLVASLETQHTQDGQIIADKIEEIAELGEKVRDLKSDNFDLMQKSQYCNTIYERTHAKLKNNHTKFEIAVSHMRLQDELESLTTDLAKYVKDCDVCGGRGKTIKTIQIDLTRHANESVKCPHCDNGKVRRWVVPGWFVDILNALDDKIDQGLKLNMEDLSSKYDGGAYWWRTLEWVKDAGHQGGGYWNPETMCTLTRLPDSTDYEITQQGDTK